MEKQEKEKLVLEIFQKNPDYTIKEISQISNIPSSSVQRYLKKHSKELINGKTITIQEQLKINKEKGNRKGGINSFKNNDYVKDDKGHFQGNKKTISEKDKEFKKQKDILIICKAYLEDPNQSLEELAKKVSKTKDYVYDCLCDNRLEELIGNDLIEKIQNNLKSKGSRRK